ncbi:XRE family transcriptional regulator [Roseiarcaceae bacterium H3SJ34-1]|uniref:XRE family transcriptional regulator n=1 Tax=Terripilifer ovatus TaxID=3032367 RepID=UPI003AB956D7|nr:XRE family transcriptional regulator [Roseiarcaceae bacterium H3SJ34-1]
MRRKFDPPWKVLVKASRKALPDATDEALNWGLFFLLGALDFVNPSRGWLSALSGGKCDAADTDAAFRHLLPFLAGGLRAMSAARPAAKAARPLRRVAGNMKLRSALISALKDHIARTGLSQSEAAKLLGTTQPRLSDLMRAKIDLFDLDTLVTMTGAASLDVDMRISDAA